MSKAQRIIKYLAVAFALFLVFSIVSGIMMGISSISNIFNDKGTISDKVEGVDIDSDIFIIDIDVATSNIVLETSNTLTAKTNNEYITIRQDGNKLFIKEKDHNFIKDNGGDLVVSIPSNYVFDAVSIESGAGKVIVDKLVTNKLYLELGAGRVNIDELEVLHNAEIDGGAGEMIIKKGTINNLDLDMGVGKVSVLSKITGNSKIDSGVGAVDLNLIGTINDYKINIKKGIGSIIIDGNDMSNNSSYGNGLNNLNIEGGIGRIKIDFAR